MQEKKFLKDTEVAERLSLGVSSTRKLMTVIPNVKRKIGKSVRYDWEVIEKYLRENETIEF